MQRAREAREVGVPDPPRGRNLVRAVFVLAGGFVRAGELRLYRATAVFVSA